MNGMNGSICLNDLLAGATIVAGPGGKPFLDLTSLPDIFQKSDKNGKTYFTVFIDMYDELNQYNQCGKITLPKTEAQKAAGAYSTIIGNLKYNQQKQAAPPAQNAAAGWGQAPAANGWGAPANAAQPPAAANPSTWVPAGQGSANDLPF